MEENPYKAPQNGHGAGSARTVVAFSGATHPVQMSPSGIKFLARLLDERIGAIEDKLRRAHLLEDVA